MDDQYARAWYEIALFLFNWVITFTFVIARFKSAHLLPALNVRLQGNKYRHPEDYGNPSVIWRDILTYKSNKTEAFHAIFSELAALEYSLVLVKLTFLYGPKTPYITPVRRRTSSSLIVPFGVVATRGALADLQCRPACASRNGTIRINLICTKI